MVVILCVSLCECTAYLGYPDLLFHHLSNIVHWLSHRSNQNVGTKEVLCVHHNTVEDDCNNVNCCIYGSKITW